MRVERDIQRMEYVIRIHRDELCNVFASAENYYKFLRELSSETLGKPMADIIFPINEEVEENDN